MFLATVLLVVLFSKAGSRSSHTFGKFRFFPKTSLFGEKPWTFFYEFLSLTAQETASCKLHLMYSIVLLTVRPRMALCFSIKPLLQELSAAVVHILIFKFSQSVGNSVLTNSPPLSTKILLKWPKIPFQYWKFFFTINSFFLDVTRHIVHKWVLAPPFFLRHPPLDPACPLPFFKSLFPLPYFLFHPLLRYFRQFPPPSCNPLLP